MRILLGIHNSHGLGGTQTWGFTLAAALRGLGHEVDLVAMQRGDMDEWFGCAPEPTGRYDWSLISTNPLWNHWKDRPELGRKAFVCHGIDCQLDVPPAGAELYLAVSQEVQEHLTEKGIEAHYLPQPIDCEQFRPLRKISAKPQKALLSDQDCEVRGMAAEVCREMEIDALVARGVFLMHAWIDAVDIVIAGGRLALEGMACARAVIVAGAWRASVDGHGDGLMTDGTRAGSERCNYIGRAFRQPVTPEWLRAQIEGYRPEQGAANRAWVVRRNNATKVAKKLLTLLSD